MAGIEDWTDIVPSLAKIPLTAYQHRHRIQRWWKQLLVYAERGATNVVVTGRPSVGKSVLISHLHGEATDLSWELPNTSTKVETRAIQIGEWTQIVRAIPGQTSKERDQGLFEAFSKHEKLEGVIHVVDWGYTPVWDPTAARKLIEDDGIDTVEKLRACNLEKELEEFQRICTKIREAHNLGRGPKWLAIAVNKADLFMDQLPDAQKYYHQEVHSDFTGILNELIKQVGQGSLKAVSTPVCSWETDFTWNKEIIKTRSGGREVVRSLFRNFIQELSRLSDN